MNSDEIMIGWQEGQPEAKKQIAPLETNTTTTTTTTLLDTKAQGSNQLHTTEPASTNIATTTQENITATSTLFASTKTPSSKSSDEKSSPGQRTTVKTTASIRSTTGTPNPARQNDKIMTTNLNNNNNNNNDSSKRIISNDEISSINDGNLTENQQKSANDSPKSSNISEIPRNNPDENTSSTRQNADSKSPSQSKDCNSESDGLSKTAPITSPDKQGKDPATSLPGPTAPSSTSNTVDNSKAKTTARKRKPRSASNDSVNQAKSQPAPPEAPAPTTASPPKRSRKKKTDQAKPNDTTQAKSQPPAPPAAPAQPTITPPKRSRKKKVDPAKTNDANNNSAQPGAPLIGINNHLPQYGSNPQLLSVAGAGGMPLPSNQMITNTSLQAQPPMSHLPHSATTNRNLSGLSPLDIQQHASQDPANRYFSLTISPYSNYDYTNAASLTRPSLSRLFTSSSSSSAGQDIAPPPLQTAGVAAAGPMSNQHHNIASTHTSQIQHSDEISKAFEDLRDSAWNHLSKCILDQAQQFDIPSLIGTLYTLRSENEKLVNKVRDLTMKRDQLLGINARLDLPGPMLTQHLSHTSPNFSSVVAGLTNSPKSLPNSSPSPAMNKSPLVPSGPYANHIAPHGPPPPPGSCLGPPSYIDRSSPIVGIGPPHPGVVVSSLKSSAISTPSPPTGALLAHGANNRSSLMTVNNSPYLSSLHPSMNALNQLGQNPPSSSYHPRQ